MPGGGGPAAPTNVGETSISPLLYELSSVLSLCPWSAVSAWDGDSRNGFDAPVPLVLLLLGAAGALGLLLGLWLNRSTPASGPKLWFTSSGLTRLLTFGVCCDAANGVSPARFMAFG